MLKILHLADPDQWHKNGPSQGAADLADIRKPESIDRPRIRKNPDGHGHPPDRKSADPPQRTLRRNCKRMEKST
jgi:hypothetical protein